MHVSHKHRQSMGGDGVGTNAYTRTGRYNTYRAPFRPTCVRMLSYVCTCVCFCVYVCASLSSLSLSPSLSQARARLTARAPTTPPCPMAHLEDEGRGNAVLALAERKAHGGVAVVQVVHRDGLGRLVGPNTPHRHAIGRVQWAAARKRGPHQRHHLLTGNDSERR
jgi:hypothetical protein